MALPVPLRPTRSSAAQARPPRCVAEWVRHSLDETRAPYLASRRCKPTEEDAALGGDQGLSASRAGLLHWKLAPSPQNARRYSGRITKRGAQAPRVGVAACANSLASVTCRTA